MRLQRILILLAVVVLAIVLPGTTPASAEEVLPTAPKALLHLPAETLTGMIGAELEIREAGEYRLAAQLGRPGDYPSKQGIKSVKVETVGRVIVHFDTKGYKDGVWTLYLERKNGLAWDTQDMATVTMDNRPGVPLTQPGTATGKITVVPTATGTVGVQVTVDEKAVEWALRKQSAASANTNSWATLAGSALREQTYHWYTRTESNGQYTLRLEVFDANKHSQYFDVTVTVDNRASLPQTEPGTATAQLSLPEIVSNALPIDLNFTGTVRYWRLQYITPATGRSNSIGSGTLGTAETVYWNTTNASDGTYLVLLEIEDENRHIYQVSTTTTVANKVTTTIQQSIATGEEHQFVIAVAGGLTSFRMGSTPLGYYQLTVSDLDGKVVATERTHPLNLPMQVDLPMGSYKLSVKSLFVMPGSKYSVEMKGATAWTIPLTKMFTALPVTLRQVSSVPMLYAQGSAKPTAADWYVDSGTPTTIANPDGTVDVDTSKLGEGQHVITFRSSNPVGFVTLAGFPFVVDNQTSFSDVPDNHMAHWAVELLKDAGITKGYEDGTFKPANTVTRAEFAKMLSLAMGQTVEKPYSGAFADVAAGDWYAPYVEAAYTSGIIKGYETAAGLEFKPNAPVTRAEMMVMLLRAADVPEVLAAHASVGLVNPDWKTVPAWARPSVVVGVKLGLLNERYGRTLAPAEPAERGEVALALGRMLMANQLGQN